MSLILENVTLDSAETFAAEKGSENVSNFSSTTPSNTPDTEPDRIITDFSQGGIGDCWYLASIKSLSISDIGKDIISNIIEIDSGYATVKFAGMPTFSYSISLADLAAEATDGDKYYSDGHSSGDADALLLEIALKAYTNDPNIKSPGFEASLYTGGQMTDALGVLTGRLGVGVYVTGIEEMTAQLAEFAANFDHTAITFASYTNRYGFVASHAYSIVGIDTVNQTVSIRNPWYTDVPMTIGYAQFAEVIHWINYTDLSSNNLYLYGTNQGGTLTGGVANDVIYGGSGTDVITGGAGDDTLYSCGGGDTLYGNTGDDMYYVYDTNDVVSEKVNEGSDRVYSWATSYTLSDNVEVLMLMGTEDTTACGNSGTNSVCGNSGNNLLDGGDGDDFLMGMDGNDTLIGGGGNDTLDGGTGVDKLIGGTGNDTYYINDYEDTITEAVNEGIDTVYTSVDYTLGNNLENIRINGNLDLNITGNNLNNILYGSSGNNTLNGGTGNDTMYGGTGNDTYIVDSAQDQIFENIDQGIDTVISSASYTLGSNLENITLIGGENINAIGNDSGNYIIGNSGNNILDGKAGYDSMYGGAGDDIYYIDAIGDQVFESAEEGIDTVTSGVSYALGDNLENLTLSGGENITAIGNQLNNLITGNFGNNILDGGAGDDTIYGYGGSDTFDGGKGNDCLFANTSSDNKYIFNLEDGQDTISYLNATSSNNDTIVFGSGVAANSLVFTRLVNDLKISIKNYMDSITISNWYLSFLNQINNFKFSDGTVINKNALPIDPQNDTPIAPPIDPPINNNGNTLYGGAGNDTYTIDSDGTQIIENPNSGTDTVLSSISYVLGDNLENLTLTGAGNINATGNKSNNYIIGNSGNNILNGGAGSDSMYGGSGNDIYYVDFKGDQVFENAASGTDTVVSTISYALGNNLENITLIGAAKIDATGNELNNYLVGNSGNNIIKGGFGNDTLDGGGGKDTIYGGYGDDAYFVNSTTAKLVEYNGQGNDTVYSSINYSLGTYFENLTLTGLDNINGQGNNLNNILTGNDGNNTLNGLAGTDIMIGGKGNDTYYVDNTADMISENFGEGTDVCYSSVSYSLQNNVENLVLTGKAIYGIGNSDNNYIVGSIGNNTLNGGTGADILVGGKGDDTYYIDNISDNIIEYAGQGTDSVNSTVNYALGNNLENLTLMGTNDVNGKGNLLNNILLGNSGNNVLDGQAGNDVINGGAGNDYLIGGFGNDTYKFDINGGDDTISDSLGTDKISFGKGIDKTNIALFKQGSDLIIDYVTSSGDNLITIQNQFAGNQIEKIQLSNNKSLSNIDINKIIQTMAAYSAVHTDVQMMSINDVKSNQDLMNLVTKSWH